MEVNNIDNKEIANTDEMEMLENAVILEDSEGNKEVVFAAETDVKKLIGPGALDPQDAEKLYKLSGGYTQVSYDTIENNEYNDALRDREGMVRYYKMMDDDAVRNVFNYITGAIRSVPYYIQYASEESVDLEAAAFISDQLGIESTKAGKYPFQRLLRIFEHSLQYGIGYGEIVLKLVDGKGVLDAVIPYHPLVVEKINYDNKGGPKSIKVTATTNGEDGKEIEKDIPIYKTVIFLNEDDGDMKGRSILRSAYVPYEVKRQMLKLVTSGFERFLLGIPVFKAPVGVTQASPEWAVARQMGMKFAGSPKTGMTIPAGWEFSIEAVGSQMPDALPFINMMNEAISRAMGVEYNSLGKNGNGNGGYGLSSELVQLSERTVRTYIDNFVQYINTYLIPKLMVVNYPNITNYPVLSYSEYRSEIPSPLVQMLQQLLTLCIDQPQAPKAEAEPKSKSSQKGDNTVLNAETAETASNNKTKPSSQDGGAGVKFNREMFDELVAALPKTMQDQLGYTAERRNKLLSPHQTSTQTGYRERQY